jgi:hypothetical protein
LATEGALELVLGGLQPFKPEAIKELALEALWNLLHTHRHAILHRKAPGDVLRLVFAALEAHPQNSALEGFALGALLECSEDCADELFARRDVIIRVAQGSSFENTRLALQVLGNSALTSTAMCDVLLGERVMEVLLACIRHILEPTNVDLHVVAVALWVLLVLLREESAAAVFYYKDTVPLLQECFYYGPIRIREKALAAFLIFSALPGLREDLAGNDDALLEALYDSVEAGRTARLRAGALETLCRLSVCSLPVLRWLEERTEVLVPAYVGRSGELVGELCRALARTQLDRVEAVKALCRSERLAPELRLVVLPLVKIDLVKEHLDPPPGHSHFSWWQQSHLPRPPGHTRFSW